MEKYFKRRYENCKVNIQKKKVINEVVGFLNETCQYYVQRLGRKKVRLDERTTFEFNDKHTDGTVVNKEDIPGPEDTGNVNLLIIFADMLLEKVMGGRNKELKIIARKYDKR